MIIDAFLKEAAHQLRLAAQTVKHEIDEAEREIHSLESNRQSEISNKKMQEQQHQVRALNADSGQERDQHTRVVVDLRSQESELARQMQQEKAMLSQRIQTLQKTKQALEQEASGLERRTF